MKNIYISIVLMLVIILISGYVQQTNKEEKPNQNNETISQELCEIGKEYEHNAVTPISCKCPDGYEFETISMGWGPCPREGMSDCPASVIKCVKKTE